MDGKKRKWLLLFLQQKQGKISNFSPSLSNSLFWWLFGGRIFFASDCCGFCTQNFSNGPFVTKLKWFFYLYVFLLFEYYYILLLMGVHASVQRLKIAKKNNNTDDIVVCALLQIIYTFFFIVYIWVYIISFIVVFCAHTHRIHRTGNIFSTLRQPAYDSNINIDSNVIYIYIFILHRIEQGARCEMVFEICCWEHRCSLAAILFVNAAWINRFQLEMVHHFLLPLFASWQ